MNGPGPMSWSPYIHQPIEKPSLFMPKSQNQKKKKKNTQRSRPKTVRKSVRALPCSPAACLYAESLLYPERNLSNVALPSGELALPSYKIRTTCTAFWSTGDTGVGCLSIDPYNCWVAGIGSSAVLATTSSFSGTTVPSGTSANVLAQSILSPYSAWNGTDQFRLVAAGAETRPVTPGLDRGGVLFSYVDTQHLSAAGSTISAVQNLQSSSITCFGTESLTVKSLFGPPVKIDEVQFRAPTSNSRPWVIGAFSASNTIHQTFLTTLVFYYELTGPNMSSMTPSESAPQQASIIGSTVADAVLSNASHTAMTDGFVAGVARGVSEQLSRVGFALGSAIVHSGVGYAASLVSSGGPRRIAGR